MKRRSSSVSSVALGVAIAGCSLLAATAHAEGSLAASRLAKRQAAVAAPEWTEPMRTKANGSGIKLRYAVPASLQPGQPAVVRVELSNVRGADARLAWRAPEGASVSVRGGGTVGSMALPVGQTTVVEFDVTPAADGMAYLDVFTSQGGRSTAQSLPLKVGSGQVLLKREGTVQTMPSGEKVISLPSQPK